MNEKVDLTKILKNCPKGFKLYSPMVGEVEFERILDGRAYPIITSYNERTLGFTNEGFYYDDAGAEAERLLFPSADQRDWSKFEAPWYKKEMDINSMSNKDDERLRKTAIAFLKDFAEQGYENAVECIDWLEKQGEQEEPKFKVGDWLCANELNNYANLIKIVKIVDVFGKKRYKISRNYDSDLDLTEFDFIEKHYHLWTIQDAKDGDVLAFSNDTIVIFKDLYNSTSFHSYCHIEDGIFDFNKDELPDWWNSEDFKPATKEQSDLLFQKIQDAGYKWNAETKILEKLVKPKFKVGDRIRHKESNKDDVYVISKVYNDAYGIVGLPWMLYMKYQDRYEFVPNKFDITTLKPFNKVLVRDSSDRRWRCALFSHVRKEDENYTFKYVTTACTYEFCIPYNDDTKHLVGTNEDAPEFYRYWED